MIKILCKYALLCGIGGVVYYGIELVYRGYSHWTMALVGGICFVAIGLLNQWYEWDMALTSQMFVSGFIITGVELAAGLILNVWLGLDIWDYSAMPIDFMGQICLPFSLIWAILSAVIILLDDYVRYYVFGEDKPRYRFI